MSLAESLSDDEIHVGGLTSASEECGICCWFVGENIESSQLALRKSRSV